LQIYKQKMKKTKETPSVKPQTAPASYNTRKSSQRKEEKSSMRTETSSKRTMKEAFSQHRRNSVSAPTISSESKRKEPIKDRSIRSSLKKAFSQPRGQKADSNSTILKKSKAEKKKESKSVSKRQDREEAPYGMDSPTPKDIQTSKRHAAEDTLRDQSNPSSLAPIQPTAIPETQHDPNVPGANNITDTILPGLGDKEEEEEEKPSPTQRKSSKKSTSKKSAASSKSIEPKLSSPNQDLMDSEVDVSRSVTIEEFPSPVQDDPNQPQASPKSSPSVRSVKDSQSNAASRPLEQNPLQRRPRAELDTEELPGEKKAKKVKDNNNSSRVDGAIIPSSRHVLRTNNQDLAVSEVKELALKMLQDEDFIKKCEWAFFSTVEHNIWLCHRALTSGAAKRFGFIREDMPERERQSRWDAFESSTRKSTYGFERLYLSPAMTTMKKQKKSEDHQQSIDGSVLAPESSTQQKTNPAIHATNIADPSLLSGVTGQDHTTTIRSSEFGDHTPIVHQNVFNIPLSMCFLNPPIVSLLKHLIHDYWTVSQLKGKFFKSGHQLIFEAILKNEADLLLYEKGVAETFMYLSKEEQEKLNEQKTQRDDLILNMPRLPPTTKVEDAFAEAGFDLAQNDH